MDCVTDRLETGQAFHVLTTADKCTKECQILELGISLTENPVLACLNQFSKHRPLPKSETMDNRSEFAGRTLDTWEYQNGVKLDFIRPSKSVEYAFVESFRFGKMTITI
jgi:putative transposase